MGNVVPRKAATERIVDDFEQTLVNARARGGDVQDRAEDRLGGLAQPIADNKASLESALDTLDQINAGLEAADEESDGEIGAVCDEIWNALGRPAQSTDYAMIVGTGITEWRNGPPEKQPHKMSILATNIRQSGHPKLAGRKEEWANRIEVKAAAQAEVAKPLQAADALAAALRSQQRGLANHAQAAITRLKRDYKNDGMTEAQIHEIIPDYGRTRKPAQKPTG